MKLFSVLLKNRHPLNDVNGALIFIFGSPILFCLGGNFLPHIENPLLLRGLWILFLAHGICGLLFVVSSFLAPKKKEDSNNPLREAITLAIAGAGLYSMLCLFLTYSTSVHNAKDRSCLNTLKTWQLVYTFYAGESENNVLPALSPNPGQLTPQLADVYPEYLSHLDLLQCPRILRPHLRLPCGAADFGTMADLSYFYLGYVLDRPETLRAFHDAYEKAITERRHLESNISVPDGQGNWGGDRIYRLTNDSALLLQDSTYDHNNPVEHSFRKSEVPIMIERPEHHQNAEGRWGGHVLFMDGHVEFLAYPSEWPMTQEAISLLRAMDEMGPYIPRGTFRPSTNNSRSLWLYTSIGLGVTLFALLRFSFFPYVTLPLVYALVAMGIYAQVALESPRYGTLPVATPDGTVTLHVVDLEKREKGAYR